MIEFTPYRNVENIINNSAYKISIDTLRSLVYKRTLFDYLTKRGLKVKNIKSHSKISANVKKLLWTKKTTGVKQIITPYFKNIIVTTPYYLNRESNYRKFSLIAFGLSQYNKPLHAEAKKELLQMFSKFDVTSYDLSIDLSHPLDTSILSNFGEITSKYSTIYINKPYGFNNIAKICYYDKGRKDNLHYQLYRLELTIKTKGKLQDMFLPDGEIHQIIEKISDKVEM